ncbi:MAG: hypothetical protein NTW87_30765, partial [Planctomycetota bacterium]|nr:hypothetical protein [Planctomycetota bacterium]
MADRVLTGWVKDSSFYCGNQAEIEAFLVAPEGQARKGALAGARGSLAALGILQGEDGKPAELRLIRPAVPASGSGGAPAVERATRFE